MNAGRAQEYDVAVQLLDRVRDIYLQHNREQEWETYLASVRSQHARKYKLMSLLQEIGEA